MEQQLIELKNKALDLIGSVTTVEALELIEIEILGRKGALTEILRGLKDLSLEEKLKMGPLANSLKQELEAMVVEKKELLQGAKKNEKLQSEWCDVTYAKVSKKIGSLHPLTHIQRELEDIFMRMGFTVVDGPELDSEWNNFDALNIPNTHPARDMQDTFFIDLPETEEGKWVLRTHTSNLQNRILKSMKPPFRVFVPGKVFRNEAIDATHEMIFHQCEGVVVGKEVSLANLKYVIEEALSAIFGMKIETRFRPGYFPFVEPGLELDFYNPQMGRWIEFMGCGMMHPRVIEMGGLDPKEYQGFAFGFGVTRLAMMKYGITDIRQFLQGDMKFSKQF